MIIACGLLIGLVLGFACGGRLRYLAQTRIRGEAFLVAVLICQVAIPMLLRWGEVSMIAYYLWLASFVGMAYVALLNLGKIGFIAVLVGTMFNLLTIGANEAMPVSWHSMIRAGYSGNPAEVFGQGHPATHEVLSSQTRLTILSDVMPLPGPRLFESVVSIGDVLLVVGVVVFLVWGMQGALARDNSDAGSGKSLTS